MTLTELQALSPDELRVRVAEFCGWTLIKDETDPRFPMDYPMLSGFKHGAKWFIPNYTGSLDSCREFEAAMTDEEHWQFREFLRDITSPNGPDPRAYISATPLQKCQAYVLTMEATKTEGAE